jgi:hypothetical protein
MSRSLPTERDQFIQTSESFLETLPNYLLLPIFFLSERNLNPSYQLPMLSEPETVEFVFRRLVEIWWKISVVRMPRNAKRAEIIPGRHSPK